MVWVSATINHADPRAIFQEIFISAMAFVFCWFAQIKLPHLLYEIVRGRPGWLPAFGGGESVRTVAPLVFNRLSLLRQYLSTGGILALDQGFCERYRR